MQRYGPSGFIADSLHPLNSLNLRRAQDAIEMPKHANAINVEPVMGHVPDFVLQRGEAELMKG